jgi:SipW-cognate class signal peptide
MTNSKSIKRALILSILLIVVCVSMLIGTTFAWFTDTAETSVNTIQAGTLDVALQMYDGEKWVLLKVRP